MFAVGAINNLALEERLVLPVVKTCRRVFHLNFCEFNSLPY